MKPDEIKKFDGKDGRPAYVVFKGNIYDVTDSKLWRNGSHVNRHFAGEDLRHQMSVAPHNEDVLSRFRLVGRVEEEEKDRTVERMDKHRDWYRKFHPHPVFVHFPIALFFFTGIMQALFLIFNDSSFENAASYSLFVGAAMTVPSAFSGIYSWIINYQRTLTKIFKIKLYGSIVLTVISTAAVLIRIFNPEVSFVQGAGFYIYNLILFTGFPIVSMIGYFGGKITWPG